MGMFSKTFFYLLLVSLLAGCSGKPSTPRNLEVSFAAEVAATASGGAIVRIQNAVTGTSVDVELSAPPFTVSVADGKWNFYFVGFAGPGAWAGGTQCGGALAVDLGPTTTDINITIGAAACASAPYPTLIATKVSNWDQAIWDQSKWGL